MLGKLLGCKTNSNGVGCSIILHVTAEISQTMRGLLEQSEM